MLGHSDKAREVLGSGFGWSGRALGLELGTWVDATALSFPSCVTLAESPPPQLESGNHTACLQGLVGRVSSFKQVARITVRGMKGGPYVSWERRAVTRNALRQRLGSLPWEAVVCLGRVRGSRARWRPLLQ